MVGKEELLDFEVDEQFWERWRARQDELTLKSENRYAADIVENLLPFPKGRHSSWVMDDLEKERRAKGLPIPKTFNATVQSAYNNHCVGYAAFVKRGSPPTEGLFYSPGPRGYWAVNEAVAKAWLASKMR
jgi:hypothetical protein